VEEDALVPLFRLVTGKLPVTPVVNGKPVALVNVTDVGVPKTGVTNVGDVDKTLLPDPVDVVTPVPPFATGKVPVTPVDRGKPVAFVKVPEVGVPKMGVTKVGDVDRTLLPEPVEVVTPVPPFATGKVPVTPVDKGKPVPLVKVTDVGVPKTGVTKVGDVDNTLLPDPVLVMLTTFLLASNANAVETVNPDNVTAPDAANVVKAPVPAVVAPMFTPSKVVDVAPKATDVEPIVTLEFSNLALAIDPANIVLVTVPVSPEVIMFPVTAGTVIVKVDAVFGPVRLT
jgi:hypothetical protein